jgi:hypothetical protein
MAYVFPEEEEEADAGSVAGTGGTNADANGTGGSPEAAAGVVGVRTVSYWVMWSVRVCLLLCVVQLPDQK